MSEAEFSDETLSVLNDTDFLSGIVHDKIIDVVKKHHKENVFTCHSALKNMDYGGGQLNYQGIELLRVVERDFFWKQKIFMHATLERYFDLSRQ